MTEEKYRALQKLQHAMPEPWAGYVCDILANGSVGPQAFETFPQLQRAFIAGAEWAHWMMTGETVNSIGKVAIVNEAKRRYTPPE